MLWSESTLVGSSKEIYVDGVGIMQSFHDFRSRVEKRYEVPWKVCLPGFSIAINNDFLKAAI